LETQLVTLKDQEKSARTTMDAFNRHLCDIQKAYKSKAVRELVLMIQEETKNSQKAGVAVASAVEGVQAVKKEERVNEHNNAQKIKDGLEIALSLAEKASGNLDELSKSIEAHQKKIELVDSIFAEKKGVA